MASAKQDVSCLFTNPYFVTNLIKKGLAMTATANLRLVLALSLEIQVTNSTLLFAVSNARDLGQMTSALKMLAVDDKQTALQVTHAALLAAARYCRTGASAVVLAQQARCYSNLVPASLARRKTRNTIRTIERHSRRARRGVLAK
jgi:hypothetical protein